MQERKSNYSLLPGSALFSIHNNNGVNTEYWPLENLEYNILKGGNNKYVWCGLGEGRKES